MNYPSFRSHLNPFQGLGSGRASISSKLFCLFTNFIYLPLFIVNEINKLLLAITDSAFLSFNGKAIILLVRYHFPMDCCYLSMGWTFVTPFYESIQNTCLALCFNVYRTIRLIFYHPGYFQLFCPIAGYWPETKLPGLYHERLSEYIS